MSTNGHEDADLGLLLSRLQTLMLNTPDLESFLEGVADLASMVVEPPAACGITTRYDGHPTTVATSDDRAALVDEQQYSTGTGPCLDAMRTGEVVEVVDLAGDDRWPGYRERAVDLGVRWSLSMPLNIEQHTLGALNIYGYERPRKLDPAERERVERFAEQASTGIALAIRQSQQAKRSLQLESALVSRSVIDQAIGVLMAQERCSSEQAFELLRHHSQNTNQKLRDVAAGVITRLTGHSPAPTVPFEDLAGPTAQNVDEPPPARS